MCCCVVCMCVYVCVWGGGSMVSWQFERRQRDRQGQGQRGRGVNSKNSKTKVTTQPISRLQLLHSLIPRLELNVPRGPAHVEVDTNPGQQRSELSRDERKGLRLDLVGAAVAAGGEGRIYFWVCG